jgi:hypothetical protein
MAVAFSMPELAPVTIATEFDIFFSLTALRLSINLPEARPATPMPIGY